MVLEKTAHEHDFRDRAGREIAGPALQTAKRVFVLEPPGGQARGADRRRFAGEAVIGAEKLPAIGAEGLRSRGARQREPRMAAVRHRPVLTGQDGPAERPVLDRQEVDILRGVGLVVADGLFVRQPEVLSVEHVDAPRNSARVVHPHAPDPGGMARVKVKDGRATQAGPDVGLPDRRLRSRDGETKPGTNEPRPAGATVFVAPAHQEPKQAVLRRSRKQLVDQGLAVAQSEQRARRQQLHDERRTIAQLQQPQIGCGRDDHLLGNSACVVDGLVGPGPAFAEASAGRPGSATPTTNSFLSGAKRVLRLGLHGADTPRLASVWSESGTGLPTRGKRKHGSGDPRHGTDVG